eukprot:1038485-Prymnesium_polylepis.1
MASRAHRYNRRECPLSRPGTAAHQSCQGWAASTLARGEGWPAWHPPHESQSQEQGRACMSMC